MLAKINAKHKQVQSTTTPTMQTNSNISSFTVCQTNAKTISATLKLISILDFILNLSNRVCVCVCGPVGALMRTRCHSKPPRCSKYATACHKRIREQTANSLVYRLICTYLEYLLNDAFLINYKTISLHLN